jgi:antitoxin VapB
MIHLSHETEALAIKLAAAQHLSVDAAVQRALEDQARGAGIDLKPTRRRMTAERMRAFAAEFAALPVRDPRSPVEIADDLNAI